MQLKVVRVRTDDIVIGSDGRRRRVVDLDFSLISVFRPWIKLHLRDVESGEVAIVRYDLLDLVEVEQPPESP